MARGQGAPGVRVALFDESAVSSPVINPSITAGFVGVSSQGELNKVIKIRSLGELTQKTGSGFQDPRLNHALYGMNAVLSAGGVVDFVRVYSEQINPDDTTSGELQTDSYVVSLNGSTLNVDYFHASRLKSLANATTQLGLERGFYDIFKTTTIGRNSEFSLELDGPNVGSAMPIFAIVNSDPTSAYRYIASSGTETEVSGYNYGVDNLKVEFASVGYSTRFDYVAKLNKAAANDFKIKPFVAGSDLIEFSIDSSVFNSVMNTPDVVAPIWKSAVEYVVGDFVKHTISSVTKLYVCVTAHTSSSTFATANFEEVTVFSASTSYDSGDYVLYGPTTVKDVYQFTSAHAAGAWVGTDANKIEIVDVTKLGFIHAQIASSNLGRYTVATSVFGEVITSLSQFEDSARYNGSRWQYMIPTYSILVQTTQRDVFVRIVGALGPTYANNKLDGSVYESEVPVTYVGQSAVSVVKATVGTHTISGYNKTDMQYCQFIFDKHPELQPTEFIINSAIGSKFQSLGLVDVTFSDYEFTGSTSKVYTLNDAGKAVAAIYVNVTYSFNEKLFQFSGTLVPYVYNDQNLYIGLDAEKQQNGWELLINQSPDLLNMFATDAADLTEVIMPDSSKKGVAVKFAFVQNKNDLWIYNEKANLVNKSGIAVAWNMFVDRDISDVDMLVAAGTNIDFLHQKKQEQLNTLVMSSMLSVCEKRKDCYALFDGIDYSDIELAIDGYKPALGFGALGRWGALHDGRSIFTDSVYTKLDVEGLKSNELAYIITANRASGKWWLPPAGYDTGRVPGLMSKKQKFQRSFIIAEDPNSDIARLYDININPTRVTPQGAIIFGEKTLLLENTSLNRLHSIMLVAGIHKRFVNYLDRLTFKLNTSTLRASISADLQLQLTAIVDAGGLNRGIVVCDDSNNTPEVIDNEELYVDIYLQITPTSEFITLRTHVQRNGETGLSSVQSTIV